MTLARGAPRPLSWTISLTTPRMWPLRSACALIALHFLLWPCCSSGHRAHFATYEIESAELGGSLVQTGVGREDGASALPLIPDHATAFLLIIVTGGFDTDTTHPIVTNFAVWLVESRSVKSEILREACLPRLAAWVPLTERVYALLDTSASAI